MNITHTTYATNQHNKLKPCIQTTIVVVLVVHSPCKIGVSAQISATTITIVFKNPMFPKQFSAVGVLTV